MAEDKEKSTRMRGGGFPSVDLGEAIEMIKLASSAGWDMPRETFASAIHSSPNSGPFLGKIAGLRDFGLIERGDRVRLTSLAKTLIAPVSDEETVHQENLQRAFFSCDVFKVIYEKLRDTSRESSLEVIANLGMHEFRVSPKRKILFARNFFESGRIAGLLSGDGNRLKVETPGESSSASTESSVEQRGQNPRIEMAVTKGKFKFQDSGVGWDLMIVSSQALDSTSRRKILELIEALENSNVE